MVAAMVAHQGGWDEFLLVAAPVAVIAGLLAIAKRRVDRGESRVAESSGERSTGGDPLDAGTDSS